MKKIILLLLLLTPLKTKAIDTSATSSILMDIDSNRILYEENIHNDYDCSLGCRVMYKS